MNSIYQHAITRLILLFFSLFFMTAAMAAEGEQDMTLILKSVDFAHQGEIPKIHTCEGGYSSPGLSRSGFPQHTKSLVLIVDDPDAPDPTTPKMTWAHWPLSTIPPTVTEIPKGVVDRFTLRYSTRQKSLEKTGYRGPCPPICRHGSSQALRTGY